MTSEEGDRRLAATDVEVRAASTREYEFAVAAAATVDGPGGRVRVRRRYEALPRHNDVVDPDAVDSNDRLVARPDAIHVHTRFYSVAGEQGDEARAMPALGGEHETRGTDGEGVGDYFLDTHGTLLPGEPEVLGDEAAFREACRGHHLGSLERAYALATGEREDA